MTPTPTLPNKGGKTREKGGDPLTCSLSAAETAAVWRVGMSLPGRPQLDLQRVAPLLQGFVLRLVQGDLGQQDGRALVRQVPDLHQSRLRQLLQDGCQLHSEVPVRGVAHHLCSSAEGFKKGRFCSSPETVLSTDRVFCLWLCRNGLWETGIRRL